MLRKYSSGRTLGDNVKLGVLTAFTAGTINIASLLIFLNFTSNVTGHYAILSAEISKGNWAQVGIVGLWIFLFFFGSFLSNFIVLNITRINQYLAHSLPILLEISCLLFVGIYGQYYYGETQREAELLVAVMLFATGLQNGLTASISNFSIKTTHLTGTTTDLGILFSMFTKKKYRKNNALIGRAKVLTSIMFAYVAGAVFSGLSYYYLQFKVFYVICICLFVVVSYDLYKIHLRHFNTNFRYHKIYKKTNLLLILVSKVQEKRFKKVHNNSLMFEDK